MKWLNITGMVLQFLAFWFAAPELLGAETLRRFEKGLQKFIAKIPLFVTLAVMAAYGVTFLVMSLMKGIEGGKRGMEASEIISFYIILGTCTLVYFVFILFYKRINKWLDTKIAQPLTHRLIHSNETRRTALLTGALLFTTGFLLSLFSAIFA